MNILFLISRWHFPSSDFYPLPLVLLLCIPVKTILLCTSAYLSKTTFWVLEDCDWIPHGPSFVWKTQLLQPFLLHWVLQHSNHWWLSSSSLPPIFQCLFWTKEKARLSEIVLVWPDKCQVERNNHISWFAGCTLADADQDTVCCLCCWGRLLAYAQLAVCLDPQGLFSGAAPQPTSHQPVLVLGIIPSQLQDFTFVFIKPQTFIVLTSY